MVVELDHVEIIDQIISGPLEARESVSQKPGPRLIYRIKNFPRALFPFFGRRELNLAEEDVEKVAQLYGEYSRLVDVYADEEGSTQGICPRAGWGLAAGRPILEVSLLSGGDDSQSPIYLEVADYFDPSRVKGASVEIYPNRYPRVSRGNVPKIDKYNPRLDIDNLLMLVPHLEEQYAGKTR